MAMSVFSREAGNMAAGNAKIWLRLVTPNINRCLQLT